MIPGLFLKWLLLQHSLFRGGAVPLLCWVLSGFLFLIILNVLLPCRFTHLTFFLSRLLLFLDRWLEYYRTEVLYLLFCFLL